MHDEDDKRPAARPVGIIRGCYRCQWWANMDDIEGECRVNSPSIGEGGYSEWPMTMPEEWCGRFEGRDNPLDERFAAGQIDHKGLLKEVEENNVFLQMMKKKDTA